MCHTWRARCGALILKLFFSIYASDIASAVWTLSSEDGLLAVMCHTRNVPWMLQTANLSGPYLDPVSNPRGERFATWLDNAIRRSGLTHEAIEQLSGVSRSTLARWKRGDANTPDPDNLHAVCQVLSVDPDEALAILGYLRDKPTAETPEAPPTIQQAIDALRDPLIPDAEKEEWADLLIYMHQRARKSKPGNRRAS